MLHGDGRPLGSSALRAGLTQYGLVSLLLYGALAALFAPFTWPIRAATALPAFIVVVMAVWRGWLRPGVKNAALSRYHPGLLLWVAVFVVMIAFQLLNFFEWPRTVYPTLSSLLSTWFAFYPARALAFGLWIWLGWYVVDR